MHSMTPSARDNTAANQPLSEAILHRQETIHVVERLCVKVSETLKNLAIEENKGFHSFVRKKMVWVDKRHHSTTTAQCILALQGLTKIMGGVKLRSPESRNLVFQTMPSHPAEEKVKPDELQKELKALLDAQIKRLANKKGKGLEEPTHFGKLNPFTCAHVFNALAPSHIASSICWEALFGIHWALFRKYPNYEARSGAAMAHSRPTAFVTGLCIDAFETFIELLTRRSQRMQTVITLIGGLEKLDTDAVSTERSKSHKTAFLIDRLIDCLEEAAGDAALSQLFKDWKKEIKRLPVPRTADAVCLAFAKAVETNKGDLTTIVSALESQLNELKKNTLRRFTKLLNYSAQITFRTKSCWKPYLMAW